MTPERFRRIEELFDAVIELPAGARSAVLDRECGEDIELREEVVSLVSASERGTDRVRGAIRKVAEELVSEPPARRIGPFRVVDELGEGGMGAVFLAVRDDDSYHTNVAIKLLHRGMETANAVARFRDERQILATLDHPGIVRLLDGGSTEDGRPYLVMEHIDGTTITRFADDHALSVRARVELFRKVCAAVQLAHQKLVVHRDIKPSNILVTSDGTPKLLDFGIAKLLEPEPGLTREAQTRTGMRLLTPEYASPEQARGEPVSTSTDIYSLGAVLYELLANTKAHRIDGSGLAALDVILNVDPPRPSSVAPPARMRALAGDLDAIVQKALRKEPGRRYASVEHLNEDLRRYLDGLPVDAQSGSWTYRAGKFVRRNRVLVVAAVVVATTLSGATAISIRQARRADAAAREAQQRFDDVRALANSMLFEVDDAIQDVEGTTAARELIVKRAREYLDRLARQAHDVPELSRELAIAYMKIGDIQGAADRPNLGEPDAGLESYHRAEEILADLPDAVRDSPTGMWALAHVYFGMGPLHMHNGDLAGVRRTIHHALDLVARIPESADYDYRMVAAGYATLFFADTTSDRPDDAARDADETFALTARWASRDPSAEPRYFVVVAREMRGRVRGDRGDADGAVDDHRVARTILEKLMAEHEDNPAYRREVEAVSGFLAKYLSGIGDSQRWSANQGDRAGAETAIRGVIAHAEHMVARDPKDSRAREQLASILADLGANLSEHDVPAAIPVLDRARSAFAELPAKDRASWYNEQNELFFHCTSATALASVGRAEEARDEAKIGLAMVERVNRSGHSAGVLKPTNDPMCRYLVARMARTLGDPTAAGELLDRAAADLRSNIAAHSTNLTDFIGLAEVLELLAEIRVAEGCDLRDRAAVAFRAWPAAPTTYTRRRQEQLDAAATNCRAR